MFRKSEIPLLTVLCLKLQNNRFRFLALSLRVAWRYSERLFLTPAIRTQLLLAPGTALDYGWEMAMAMAKVRLTALAK